MHINNKLGYFKSIAIIISISIFIITNSNKTFGQCQPYIMIDTNAVDPTTLDLPFWLHEGQTLDMNNAVTSISVVEFTINGATLEFSAVLSINSNQTVPAGKVWKVESIAMLPLIGTVLTTTSYTTAGVHSFTVPNCTNYICIEVWGAGGGGGGGNSGSNSNGGGGGGGSYGSGCFTVTPGSIISVTVGSAGTAGTPTVNGGVGGTTSVGTLISAGGGAGGIQGGTTGGAGGAGGTCSAMINLPGNSGTNGSTGSCNAGAGGAGANGGVGGTPGCNTGGTGGYPGGGGGGGNVNGGSPYSGGKGGVGKVTISW